MKRSDFISPAARLDDALRQLEFAWQATNEHWSDSVSQKVEDEYLVPLHATIRTMLDAVTKLSSVVKTAESECSHPRERNFYL
jgi:hypothetical protein